MTHPRRRTLALAYFGSVALLIVLADLGFLGTFIDRLHTLPLGDKVFHTLLATGLAFFASFALKEPLVQVGERRLLRASLALTPAVALEELSQRWIPWRTFDLADLIADALGLALGSALAWHALARRPAPT